MAGSIDEKSDQNEDLLTLINEVDQEARIADQEDDEHNRDIDILNLPPRKEVHSTKKSKTHFKISRPMLRLILISVVIIVIIAGVVYLMETEHLQFS